MSVTFYINDLLGPIIDTSLKTFPDFQETLISRVREWYNGYLEISMDIFRILVLKKY